jgi:hypothetical protein
MLARVATRELIKELVEVLLVELRLVTKALVVVELPMIALVILASVATRDEKNPLVDVALVITDEDP